MLVLIYTFQSIHRLTCCGKPVKFDLPLSVVNLDKAVCGDRKTSFSFWQKRKIGIHIYREFRSVGRDSYLGAHILVGPDEIVSDHMYDNDFEKYFN